MLVEYVGTPITDRDIQKIMSIDGVKAYNGIGDGDVYAKDFDFISGISFGAEIDDSRLPSVTNSEYFNFFTRKAFQLVEGRQIKEDDDHVVLISSAIAEKNNLKLGDTITVQCCFDNGDYPDVKLKVVGIYEYKGDTNPFHTTSTDKRNRLIIDHKAMQEIMQRDVIQYDNGVDFYVDDPREMEKIASQIKALDLDWDSFTLTMDNSAYEAVASPLTAMQNLIVWLIVGCVAVSVGILVLILSMWIKQRRYETGILLSVGISKSRILLQYTVEVLMIANQRNGAHWIPARKARWTGSSVRKLWNAFYPCCQKGSGGQLYCFTLSRKKGGRLRKNSALRPQLFQRYLRGHLNGCAPACKKIQCLRAAGKHCYSAGTGRTFAPYAFWRGNDSYGCRAVIWVQLEKYTETAG